ncbi:uncharacterized protein CPUR_03796 [Claviceps purpurea 20.1]|uniref:1-alkyl-2-acetylglycerophosphocholine esterase n=1 Tax=Claviceps purpurea (strain 20.1) TaxID=1111077 RepID=M1WEB2_CLAP2|nr:hypothetical protein E4U23_001919 [Claviceps purpurea]KAG6314225.1 hypothetical protein E4U44_002027 [Claviceps purpurea]CCE29949.1 uncharacterized protein CPUR_03796 [Claviceps purpurea 20.1]
MLVPPPLGPYDVAVKIMPVTDQARSRDPFVSPPPRPRQVRSKSSISSPPSKGRQLLLSAFLPIDVPHGDSPCPRMTVPYMTPRVAADYGSQAAEAGLPRDLYSLFGMEVCDYDRLLHRSGSSSNRNTRPVKKYPVVLFTPGLQESRLLYGAGARSLASRGYVVITTDHPLEASFVEFPDGTVVQGRNLSSDDDSVKKMIVNVRTADLSFVIDQLHESTLMESLLGPYLSRSMDLEKIIVYGHSLGGAAAASLARADKRVLGGIDLDGQIVEPVRSLGVDKPFLLAGRQNHSAEDATWNQFWPNLRGPRVELAINGTAHASFTDRPLLVSALHLPEQALKGLEGLIGSLPGRCVESIVNDALVGFFDYTLYRKDEGLRSLLTKYAPNVRFPRINL